MDSSSQENKLLTWIKNHPLWIFYAILLLGILVRVYVWIKTLNQPIWWDEGDYLAAAQRFGLNLQTLDLWYYRRTFFLPFFWGLLYKFGANETVLRFTELLFSTAIIALTYYLGKRMFNQWVGIIGAFGIAISRIMLFSTTRLLNSLPATMFMLAGIYFFYKGYIEGQGRKYVIYSAIFVGLALSTRFAKFLSLISFGFIFLIHNKWKFFKDKNFWIFFGIILVILAPFIYQYHAHYGGISDFLAHYTNVGASAEEQTDYLGLTGIFQYAAYFAEDVGLLLALAALAGFILTLEFVFGLDVLRTNKKQQRNLLLFLLIVPAFIFHSYFSVYREERYLEWIMPFVYLLGGYALYLLYTKLPQKQDTHKMLFIGAIIGLLLISGYTTLKAGNELIDAKKTSYLQVQQAGSWLGANTQPGDYIISNSLPQMAYYTQRNVIKMESAEVEAEALSHKPKYLVLSVFENTPPWLAEYPQKHPELVTPVQAYYFDVTQQQLALIIYEFNWTAK